MINSECNVCPEGTVKCIHYNNQAVALIYRPQKYYSVIRYRNGIEAEGHVGSPNPYLIFDHLVEYIMR